MSSSYLSPSLNFYKHVRVLTIRAAVSADLGSVGMRKVVISFPLLSALYIGWCPCQLTTPTKTRATPTNLIIAIFKIRKIRKSKVHAKRYTV